MPRKLPVFIASATKDHLADLRICLTHYPSKIFVEKGFTSDKEKELARYNVGKIPTYLMSQHRYSKIFDPLMSIIDIDKPIKCVYNWDIERDSVSEFLYHIVSLDGYIKKKDVSLYVNDFGTHVIDSISAVSFNKSTKRKLTINLETQLSNVKVVLGEHNSIVIKNKNDNKTKVIVRCTKEDTLYLMIRDIVLGENKLKLERL